MGGLIRSVSFISCSRYGILESLSNVISSPGRHASKSATPSAVGLQLISLFPRPFAWLSRLFDSSLMKPNSRSSFSTFRKHSGCLMRLMTADVAELATVWYPAKSISVVVSFSSVSDRSVSGSNFASSRDSVSCRPFCFLWISAELRSR